MAEFEGLSALIMKEPTRAFMHECAPCAQTHTHTLAHMHAQAEVMPKRTKLAAALAAAKARPVAAPNLQDGLGAPLGLFLNDVQQAFVPDDMHVNPGGLWKHLLEAVLATLDWDSCRDLQDGLQLYKLYINNTQLRLPSHPKYFSNQTDKAGTMCTNNEHKAVMQVHG